MRFIEVCCVLVISSSLWAQRVYNPLIIADELPATSTTDFAKDSAGFVWIGTSEGLCRFDGSSVITLWHDPLDSLSLSNNFINEVLYDEIRHRLWIGTDNGLNLLDLTSLKFLPLHYAWRGSRPTEVRVNALAFDNKKDLWFSVDGVGIGHYAETMDSLVLYPLEKSYPEPIQSHLLTSIMDIAADPANSGLLWLGTAAGLVRFDISEARYVPYYFRASESESEVYRNQVRSVVACADGQLLLGPWSRGLLQFRPDRNARTPQFLDEVNYEAFPGSGVVPPILQMDADHVILNSLESCVLNLKTQTLSECISMRNSRGKPYSIEIKMIDKEGRKWALSEYGAHLFDPLAEQITNFQFEEEESHYYLNSKFLEIEQGAILIIYENADGVYLFSEKSNDFQLLTPKPEDSFEGILNAQAIITRPNGDVWIVDRHHIYRVVPGQHELELVRLPIDDLPHFWIAAAQSSDGELWLGSGTAGLFRYHPNSKQIRYFFDVLKPSTEGPFSKITGIFEDSRGNIWLRRDWGHSVYIRDQDRFVNFSTLDGIKYLLTNFVEDNDGNIWAGCRDHGLVRMRVDVPDRGILETIASGSEIPFQNITAVSLDHNGQFWMITREGMVVYDPVMRTSRLFNSKDGMIMYDARFNRNPTLHCFPGQLSGGRMAYAPRAGFSIFYPDSMQTNPEIPRPYLKSVTVNDSLLVGTHPTRLAQVIFPYSQNDIEIECSAIAYTHPLQIRFEYHLGDNNWHDLENRRVKFSNLASGDYRFYYRAVNSGGLPSEILQWNFRVRPPWWRSWWFLSGSVIFALATILVVARAREKRREHVREKEREVQTLMAGLESRALRNQMNPHFLFNIFNNIQELILTGDTEKAYTYTTKFSKLLRMILDNARKDAITIEQECSFLKLYLELESLRFDDAFDYRITVEPGLELMHIPVFIVQPLVENALRHGLLPQTGAKQLEICFTTEEDAIVCSVIDNGVGLDPDKAAPQRKDRDHALEVIRHRLDLLNKAKLTVKNRGPVNGVIAQVVLPVHPVSEES